jgi:hypothetical protein
MTNGMRLICWMALVLLIGGVASAAAQERDAAAAPVLKRLVISDEALARGLADEARTGVLQGRRDSLKNGAIIGAVIGAAALGGFGAVLCNALQEPGDPSCWRGALTIGALGAGIGAAAGAGIDAMAARNTPRPVIRVRF